MKILVDHGADVISMFADSNGGQVCVGYSSKDTNEETSMMMGRGPVAETSANIDQFRFCSGHPFSLR